MKRDKTISRPGAATVGWLFLAGAVLLTASWALGRLPLTIRNRHVDVEELSAGYLFLVYGALPWLLQWAGIVAILLGARRWTPSLDRRVVLKGTSVPLILGALWWGWLVASYWKSNPLDAVLDMLMLGTQRQMGAAPLALSVMFDVFGPLTAPFLLSGPASISMISAATSRNLQTELRTAPKCMPASKRN